MEVFVQCMVALEGQICVRESRETAPELRSAGVSASQNDAKIWNSSFRRIQVPDNSASKL